MTEFAIDKDRLRSFGRVQGRKLRKGQNRLLEELLPKIAVNLKSPLDGFDLRRPLHIEIGFGYGEHLVGMAQQYPEVNFIGCEPFINGVATILKHIEDAAANNIKVLHGDARMLLDSLPDSCLDRAYILFPDPWPKTKQQKKRIINAELLATLARVIKRGGRLEIATDHVDYGNWIYGFLSESTHFKINSEIGESTKPSDWVETRYQKKAEEQGRGARFFNYLCD